MLSKSVMEPESRCIMLHYVFFLSIHRGSHANLINRQLINADQ